MAAQLGDLYGEWDEMAPKCNNNPCNMYWCGYSALSLQSTWNCGVGNPPCLELHHWVGWGKSRQGSGFETLLAVLQAGNSYAVP